MNDSVTRVSVDAVQVFCQDLKQLHIQIGEPTFADLEKLSVELQAAGIIPRVLARSTVNDAVRGKRVTLPEWEWVRSYAHVCRVYAERNRAPNVDRIPSEEYWYSRWYKTKRAGMDTAPWPVAGASGLDDGPDGPPRLPPSPGDEARPPADHGHARVDGLETGPGREFAESQNARRYFTLFGDHGVALLHAAERQHSLEADERQDSLEACCQLGLLLTCVGWVQEAEVWLSFAARDATDPIAVALLHTPRVSRGPGPNRLEFAAECLYDMAVSEEYQRRRTGDPRPASWIDLYLTVAARYGRHKDAAYHLAIRNRAHGYDDDAAYWFAFADKLGHRAAPGRFETIYEEIRIQALGHEWLDEGAPTEDGEQ